MAGPGANVIVVGVPLTLIVIVSPCATAPCVIRLVGSNRFEEFPNPMAVSAVDVPPTVIEAVPVVPVSTRSPLLPLLSWAETSKVPPLLAALMALIKPPMVSDPVAV